MAAVGLKKGFSDRLIGLVPDDFYQDHRDEIGKMIDRAVPYANGEFVTEDVLESIDEHDYWLWAEIERHFDPDGCPRAFDIHSIAVINYLWFPSRRVLNLMIVVSDDMRMGMDEFLRQMNDLAVKSDCQEIGVYGRKGWIKKLEPYGFRIPYYILRKPVGIT